MSEKDGGPAFPNGPGSAIATNGMSLRDYFAGQAIVGMLANPDRHAAEWPEGFTHDAYVVADSMLKARAKP